MAFNPNTSDLATCIAELREIQEKYSINPKRIITSRDDTVRELAYSVLAVKNVPEGFTKTRLPVFFDGATTLYISSAAPGAKAPKHSHDEGDGIRLMIGGSIHFGKAELTQRDWMFVPAGVPYEFEVGPQGAIMAYCYQCCCV